MSKLVHTLVVTSPGVLGNSLTAFLASFVKLMIVGETDNPTRAGIIASQQHPELVIFDSTLPLFTRQTTLSMVRQLSPVSKCVAIVEKTQDGEVLLGAGAHRLLFKGFSAREFNEMIQEIRT